MLVVNKSGFSKHLYNEMFILLRFSDLMFSCLVREVTGSRLACNDKLCHLVQKSELRLAARIPHTRPCVFVQ